MKKNRVIIISVLFLVMIGLIMINETINPNLKYSQEYIAGTGNIKGDVNVKYFREKSEDFDIGANKYGYAVFKNPKRAFIRLQQDYKKGIALIKKEFSLEELSQNNYQSYGVYGWQVNTGTEEEQTEARFVSSFMDIYENSFVK